MRSCNVFVRFMLIFQYSDRQRKRALNHAHADDRLRVNSRSLDTGLGVRPADLEVRRPDTIHDTEVAPKAGGRSIRTTSTDDMAKMVVRKIVPDQDLPGDGGRNHQRDRQNLHDRGHIRRNNAVEDQDPLPLRHIEGDALAVAVGIGITRGSSIIGGLGPCPVHRPTPAIKGHISCTIIMTRETADGGRIIYFWRGVKISETIDGEGAMLCKNGPQTFFL